MGGGVSPAATWLLIGFVVMIAVWVGTLRYALAMKRISERLQSELARRQDLDADIELGLRDTRWRRRQLEVVHGDKIGVVTRYSRRAR